MQRVVFIFLNIILFCSSDIVQQQRRFLYFAYGSNLFDKRMYINAPSAVFLTSAKLPNYRLDFNKYSTNWHGAVTTIVEDRDSEVWGAIWALKLSEIGLLDRQEDVHKGKYTPIYVKVYTPEGHEITVRTYQLTNNPSKVQPEKLPPERRPGDTYLQVIAHGAYQCGLPAHYIGFIYTFATNGQIADASIRKNLGYPFNDLLQ